MKYLSLNEYLKSRFGCKIYKLSLDGGFSCPNRDGTVGTGGCIFCLEGSSDFSIPCDEDAFSAIENAKALVADKGAEKYIAYFQSYTGTYAPLERLKTLYFSAIRHPDIVALSIGTRPDCLGEDVIALLSELNSIKPVFVELGLQTIHPATAAYIRRGYPLEVFDDAVARLRKAGIEVVVHMIIGLPGESREMMLQTAKYIADSGARGIKFQLLHVLKGTDLEKDYLAGKFEVLSPEEYISVLKDCLALMPEDMVIHRLTGDGPKRSTLAPLWSLDKKKVINAINKALGD